MAEGMGFEPTLGLNPRRFPKTFDLIANFDEATLDLWRQLNVSSQNTGNNLISNKCLSVE
jgi:hypothetical protein